MRFILFIGLVMVGAKASAANLLCFTEKQEFNPSDSYYMATDSNQDIRMELKEVKTGGKTVLKSTKKQTLNFEFDQSTGEKGPWSMTVESAVVDGDNIALHVTLLRSGKKYLADHLSLTENSNPESAFILNKGFAVDGKHIVYDPDQTVIDEFFKNFGEGIKAGKLKRSDLIYLEIGSCRVY